MSAGAEPCLRCFPVEGPACALVKRAYSVALLAVPVWHSLPGAPASLFLEFRGTGPEKPFGNWPVEIAIPPFAQDSDDGPFSDRELATMKRIYDVVSEDYSPFAVDVTTEPPPAGQPCQRVVFGGDGKWFYGTGYGSGTAILGGFDQKRFWPGSNVAYVASAFYPDDDGFRLGNVASHEAGHGFGLRHQATWKSDGTPDLPYNPGDAERAPVMGGVPLGRKGVWWRGTTELSATDQQDDAAALAAVLGQRAQAPTRPLGGSSFQADGVVGLPGLVFYTLPLARKSRVKLSLQLPPDGNLAAHLTVTNAKGTVWADGASADVVLPKGVYTVAVGGLHGFGDLGRYRLIGKVG